MLFSKFYEPSKTFCVYPWIHQMTTPTGKVNFCCISHDTYVSDENGDAFELDTHGFSEAWNSKYMRDIRKKMLEGKPVRGCEACYEQEKTGKRSFRQNHNREWLEKIGRKEIKRRVDSSKKNDFKVNDPAVYLDLRLGNLCNLKCRMCNPYNSVQIQKEWEKIDERTGGAYSKFWKKYGMDYGGCREWYESDVFWNSVEEFIPKLKKVYMTGGEPTLIKGNYRFLEKCKELGHAQDIELFFNINFTNLRDKFIDQINGFKWTSINASFDGFGPMNDYIRYPSKWEQCEGNFRKLAKEAGPNVGLGISPVVQVYNILEIHKVCQFAEDVKLEFQRPVLVDFLSCHYPNFLDVVHLPKSIKLKAIENLRGFYESSVTIHRTDHDSFFMKNSVESLFTRLEHSLDQEDSSRIDDFISYTQTLDEQRNQSFQEICPELFQMLEEAGYNVVQKRPTPISEQQTSLT